jgi:predicted permease
MIIIRRILAGLRTLVAANRSDRQLDDELRAYLEVAIEQKMQGGLPRDEATRAARAEMGSVEAIKDYTRDAGWEVTVDTVWRDVRHAVRTLRRSPAFTTVAILTLALGIGASTAIFSVVDAVVLRALPFDEHDRLVAVGTSRPSEYAFPLVTVPVQPGPSLSAIAPQDFFDWRERGDRVFTGLSAFSVANLTLRESDGDPEELRALRVTSEFFDVLHTPPALGRAFLPEHETPGRNRIAVISHGLWQRRFGGVADIVGRTIQLDYTSYEIAGVTPPGFTYPIGSDKPTEVWVPLVVPPEQRIRRAGIYSASLRAVGRLAEGVSLDAALARMNQIAQALEAEYPAWNKDRRVGMLPLHESVVGERTRSWMLLLLGSVTVVLLIVCANVAGLLLARASVRDREIAIRAATGASPWRIVRQLLIEHVVLWAVAAVVGVLVARWGVQALKGVMPDSIPRVAAIALDLRVLGAAGAAAIGTALLFGVFPALRSSRPNLTRALNESSRGASPGRSTQRLRRALVVAELALAVILLVGAGLFIRSFAKLMDVELGFDPRHVLTAGVILFRAEPGMERREWPALEALEARLRALPGVEGAAAISGTIPLASSTFMSRLNIPGRPFSHEDTENQIFVSSVTADYHRVMRIPLRSGRYIEDTDRAGGTAVMVINEAAAHRFFRGENPLGRTLDIQGPRQVVGVVGDVRQGGFEMEVAPTAYLPLVQSPLPGAPRSAQLLIRTAGTPLDILPAVRAAVSSVLPGEPVRDARTLEAALSRLTAQRRVSMLLLVLFGALGVVISAVGVYGIMAYLVSERTQEIGIRMALGATHGQVIATFLREAAALTGLGLAIGAVGAWLVGSTASIFLFQTEPTDLRVFAAAVLILAASVLVASALPARRAATINPLAALRQE